MAQMSISDFGDKVSELMPVIAREFVKLQAAEFVKTKITFPQFVVLEMLENRGELKMTDLAHALGVTTAAMTGIVDRLVRDGYIARAHDTEDRRIVNVKLTAKGSKMVREMMDNRKKITIKMFSGLTPEEREQYLNILTRVHDQLAKGEDGAR